MYDWLVVYMLLEPEAEKPIHDARLFAPSSTRLSPKDWIGSVPFGSDYSMGSM